MLRWLLIFISGAVFGVGIYMTMWPQPERITLENKSDIEEMVNARSGQQVVIDSMFDRERIVFATHIPAPAFAPCPSSQTHSLQGTRSDQRRALIGCMVSIRGSLAMDKYSIDHDASPPELSRLRRHIAPVSGSNALLWVVSQTYEPESAQERAWLNSEDHRGRLVLLSDLAVNLPGWFSLSMLSRLFENHRGMSLPGDALVIIAESTPQYASEKQTHPLAFAPVKRTDDLIIAEFDHRYTDSLKAPLKGMLEPLGGTMAEQLSLSLGHENRKRIAILRLRTQDQSSRDKLRKSFATAGLILGVISVMWALMRSKKKTRTSKK